MNTTQNGLSTNGASPIGELVHEVLLAPCRKVRAFVGQPRQYFKLSSLRELADSINEIGQTTPVLVRRINPPEDGYEFELIEGERRYRACLMLNRLLKVEVDPDVTNEKQQFEKSVAANFGREGHTPVESARAIEKLRTVCGKTVESIARTMGRSVGWVNQYSNLLKLDPQVLELLEPEKTPEEKLLNITVGFLLVTVPMPHQLDLAKRISEQGMETNKARALIHATLSDKGMRQSIRPRREFGRMSSFAKKINDQIEELCQTSDSQLEHILRSPGLQKRMELLEQIEKAEENCRRLKAKLAKMYEEM